jgi:hypothetical protein
MAMGSLQPPRWVRCLFAFAVIAFEDSEVSTVYSVKFAMLPSSHPQSANDRALEPVDDADMSP